MLGTCAPRPVGWYAELRWKQKLEAAGFVVRETPWIDMRVGLVSPPAITGAMAERYEVWARLPPPQSCP